jgi:hypothetical protein
MSAVTVSIEGIADMPMKKAAGCRRLVDGEQGWLAVSASRLLLAGRSAVLVQLEEGRLGSPSFGLKLLASQLEQVTPEIAFSVREGDVLHGRAPDGR